MKHLALALLLLLPLPSAAEQVVAGLSQAKVDITTDFSGAEILVFGAVKRSSPAPLEPPLQVIVTVSSPSEPVLVRRKSRRAGIWVNTDQALLGEVPDFYAIHATAPLAQALDPLQDRIYQIGFDRLLRQIGVGESITDRDPYIEALIRIRQDQDRYRLNETGVQLTEDTLFRAAIKLPADLTEGLYTTRIFLTRGGQVIDRHETTIDVKMVGIERLTYNTSRDQPVLYGILAVLIAVAAGWGAATAFRYLRG